MSWPTDYSLTSFSSGNGGGAATFQAKSPFNAYRGMGNSFFNGSSNQVTMTIVNTQKPLLQDFIQRWMNQCVKTTNIHEYPFPRVDMVVKFWRSDDIRRRDQDMDRVNPQFIYYVRGLFPTSMQLLKAQHMQQGSKITRTVRFSFIQMFVIPNIQIARQFKLQYLFPNVKEMDDGTVVLTNQVEKQKSYLDLEDSSASGLYKKYSNLVRKFSQDGSLNLSGMYDTLTQDQMEQFEKLTEEKRSELLDQLDAAKYNVYEKLKLQEQIDVGISGDMESLKEQSIVKGKINSMTAEELWDQQIKNADSENDQKKTVAVSGNQAQQASGTSGMTYVTYQQLATSPMQTQTATYISTNQSQQDLTNILNITAGSLYDVQGNLLYAGHMKRYNDYIHEWEKAHQFTKGDVLNSVDMSIINQPYKPGVNYAQQDQQVTVLNRNTVYNKSQVVQDGKIPDTNSGPQVSFGRLQVYSNPTRRSFYQSRVITIQKYNYLLNYANHTGRDVRDVIRQYKGLDSALMDSYIDKVLGIGNASETEMKPEIKAVISNPQKKSDSGKMTYQEYEAKTTRNVADSSVSQNDVDSLFA